MSDNKIMKTFNGYEIYDEKARMRKVNLPIDSYGNVNHGNDGQVLISKGNGKTEWKTPSNIDGGTGQDGASAYDIAVTHGFEGTEEEWLESLKGKDGSNGANGLDGKDGQNGVGIENIVITTDGKLEITLTSGTTLNLGTIKGTDGVDGKDGTNGKDGADGQNGVDGTDGKDGIGVSSTTINDKGELVLVYSNGTEVNLGTVVGKDGTNGADGKNGVNGVSPKIVVEKIEGGHGIMVTDYTGTQSFEVMDGQNGVDGKDGYTPVKGVDYFDGQDGAKGEKGDKGETGENGKDGSDASVTTDNITKALGYTPANQEKVSQLSEQITDYSVVGYVKTESKEVVDKIVAKRTINSLVLLMGSDIHVSAGETVRTAIKHMGQGMNEICNYITPDGAVFLGDYNYNTTPSSKAQGIEDMKYMRLCVAEIKKALLTIFLNGNHDYYSTSTNDTENRLSEDEVYALIGSHNSDKVVVDVDNLGRNYGYVDFEKQRIRLIYLNTTDIADVAYTSHLISTVQGKWFINTALNLSDKGDDEENWGVVVCSHIPLFDNTQAYTVLGNFVDKSSGSSFGVSYDFTNTKAELIAVFHGHLHNFKVTTKTTSGGNKITYICIPNAVPNRENPYTDNVDYNEVDENGNSVSYPKTEGTAEDTSFNVVIIDKDNEKIHAICYGAGYDREIDYKTGESGGTGGSETTYTNQIPISTDSSGSIYNGTGYKDDIRFGSDGSERTGATTDATGFIPCTYGDTLYFENCTILNVSGAGYQECVCFDSSKTFISKVNITTLTVGITKDENNSITSLDTSAFNSSIYGNMAFVRLSGDYIGSDSIITVNEPIE